jgi:hypothetical protein
MLEEPMGSCCAIATATNNTNKADKNDFFMEVMFNSHSF